MDVKVESGSRGRKSRVIPVRYRIRCDPAVLDKADADSPSEPPPWPTYGRGFLAYTDAERDEITAALDRVGARYKVVPEEPEVYHIVCDLEAAAAVGNEHRSWSRSDAGFVAPTAAERQRIEAALKRAGVRYTVTVRVPDQDFLKRLEGRVTTRSAALAAMATGTLPPALGDITELGARLDELAAAGTTSPEDRRGRASRGEKVSASLLITGAIACLVPGIGHLGEGRAGPGWTLLALAWLLVTIGLFLLPNLRTTWRRCGLPVALSLAAGGVIFLCGALGSKWRAVPPVPSRVAGRGPSTDTPSAPSRTGTKGTAATSERRRDPSRPKAALRAEGLPAPADGPLVAAGASVSQQTSGDNSPNVIAGGDVTINSPADPNAPIVYYFPSGKTRTLVGSNITLGDGRVTVYQTIVSLNKSKRWGELASVCEQEIETTPDWLTPYLYAGVAHANSGDLATAKSRCEEFERRARENPDYADLRSQCVKFIAQIRKGQGEPGASSPDHAAATPGPAEQEAPADSQ